MTSLTLDLDEWAETNFGTCDLGDARRTRRAVKVAGQMAQHPDGSTPHQIEQWGDLKAAYRLFDGDEVTFTSLATPHWKQTRRQAGGTVLIIGDTTEIDFGRWSEVEGLAPIGNGSGRGFLLHNSMMVNADSRESEVWGRVIDLIGPPSDEAQYVHVFDRGADNLEVFAISSNSSPTG